jgi:hypothetical protein
MRAPMERTPPAPLRDLAAPVRPTRTAIANLAQPVARQIESSSPSHGLRRWPPTRRQAVAIEVLFSTCRGRAVATDVAPHPPRPVLHTHLQEQIKDIIIPPQPRPPACAAPPNSVCGARAGPAVRSGAENCPQPHRRSHPAPRAGASRKLPWTGVPRSPCGAAPAPAPPGVWGGVGDGHRDRPVVVLPPLAPQPPAPW